MFGPKICVADTETATMKGPIVDMAAIFIDEELNETSRVETLIDPQCKIAPAAQAVHGISQDMVADAPTMAEYVENWGNPFAVEPGQQLIIIGHNVQFDIRMFVQAGLLPQTYTKVCTLRMARNLWPDLNEEEANHKLGTLAVMFGLETGPAHRAMGDTVTCLNLLRFIADQTKVGSFEELIALGTRTLSLETKITFGKHKGTKLKDLPASYVSWLLNQSDMDPDLREALMPARKQ